MTIFRDLSEVERDPNNVLTVGTFDGVHLGHQFIIEQLQEFAQRWNGVPTVVTFDPHPQIVLASPTRPPIRILTTTEQKLQRLQLHGVEKVIIIPFTRSFSRISSEEYVTRILYDTIGMKGIVIGYDHAFGRDRKGSIETLKEIARVKGFRVEQLPPRKDDGMIISSTGIRRLIAAGDMETANRCLGYFYTVVGRVIPGDGRGRKIGFPTANVELENPHQLLPADGVYAVQAKVGEESHQGMANIGFRPTFNGRHRHLEVHLFDFNRDVYDAHIQVSFISRIREERKFDSAEDLRKQLHSDRNSSLQILKEID